MASSPTRRNDPTKATYSTLHNAISARPSLIGELRRIRRGEHLRERRRGRGTGEGRAERASSISYMLSRPMKGMAIVVLSSVGTS